MSSRLHERDPKKVEVIFPSPGTPWGGLNRYDGFSRYTIGDADADDLINWLPMGNNLRQVPGLGNTIATLASPIIWMSAQILNSAIFIYALCQNGHIYQVSTGGSVTDIYAAAIITESAALHSSTSVTSVNTTNLWAGMAVTGTGIQPATTISAITGTTTLTLSLAATVTSTQTLTFTPNTFSSATDITDWEGTQIIFSDPQNYNGAVYSWNGTNVTQLFSNQPANFVCVYQGRLFGAFNNTIWFTDANTNNSLGGSAGTFTITDAACALPIVALVSFAGSLMIFGPNYIQILSNIQVFGSPPVATFTLYQLESQIGAQNKWSIIPFGSTLFFANTVGIWALNGSVPQLVSGNIDGLFGSGGLSLSSSFAAAYVSIYSVPCLFWNFSHTIDPVGVNTNFGLTNPNVPQQAQWFRSNFGTMTFITSTISSSNPTMWGTDGTKIFSVFTNLTSTVASTYNSKYWNMGQPMIFKNQQKIGFLNVLQSAATATLTVLNEQGVAMAGWPQTQSFGAGTVTFVNRAGGPLTFVNNSSGTLIFSAAGGISYGVWQFNSEGRNRCFGVSLVTSGAGAFLQAVAVQFEWSQAVWGT